MNDDAFDGGASAVSGGLGQLQVLFDAGGPVVLLLLAMSVFALTIVIAKWLQFRAAGIGETRRARRALDIYRSGRLAEAMAAAAQSRNPAAQALLMALRGVQRGLPEQKIRDEVLAFGSDALATLRAWLRPLEVIAALAPLLGLFGTVLGMIEAFQQLESAGAKVNPAVLSGGIWVALLTTAAGLAVAMPTIVALNWLERKVERLAHDMDCVVTRVFSLDLSDRATQASSDADLGQVSVA